MDSDAAAITRERWIATVLLLPAAITRERQMAEALLLPPKPLGSISL